MAEPERDPHDQYEGTITDRKFEPGLYMVVVDKTIYRYVYCGYDVVMRERALLEETGQSHRIQFVKLALADFDEINHIHFC